MGERISQGDFCLTEYGKELASKHYRVALSAACDAARKHGMDYDEASSVMAPIFLRAISEICDHLPTTEDMYVRTRVYYDMMDHLRYSLDTRRSRNRLSRMRVRAENMSLFGDSGRAGAAIESAMDCDYFCSLGGQRDIFIRRLWGEEEWTEIGESLGVTRHAVAWRFNEAIKRIRGHLGVNPQPVTPDFVEHPDWPGYGLDKNGDVWSTKRGEPRKIGIYSGQRRCRAADMKFYKGSKRITYRQFVDTHPLRDVIRNGRYHPSCQDGPNRA